MKKSSEKLLGNGVGAGPVLWSNNPQEFMHLSLDSSFYHHQHLFTHHYGKHNNAILPISYYNQIMKMSVKQWLWDTGDSLVIFPKKWNGIDEGRINFYKDEHCIVWLGFDRKIIKQIGKIAKKLCKEIYPNDDTDLFLNRLKVEYYKIYKDKPWVKITD